jgi:hypothetical protein
MKKEDYYKLRYLDILYNYFVVSPPQDRKRNDFRYSASSTNFPGLFVEALQ